MQNNFPKVSLSIAVLFLIFSCSIFVFLRNKIDVNEGESQVKEQEWGKEAQRRDEIKLLDHSVKIITDERSLLETHFARSSDVVPFLDTMENLALKVGANAQVTSVDVSKDNVNLTIGLKASGTFSSLYRFLTLLENSAYQLDFLAMDMRSAANVDVGSKASSVPQWDMTLKMRLINFVE